MPKKTISGTFFGIHEPVRGNINRLFTAIHDRLNMTDVPEGESRLLNVESGQTVIRIVDLKKGNYTNVAREVWYGIIEKLDTSELTITSNLLGERQENGAGEDEGPVTHTAFVYDPLTSCLFLHRKINGVNYEKLGVVIRNLLRKTQIASGKASSEYVVNVFPDVEKLARARNANEIHQVAFTYKMPEVVPEVGDDENYIIHDFMIGQRFEGQTVNVVVKGASLNRNAVMNKIESLLQGNIEVSTAKVVAEHNDVEEVLDLLSDRFYDYEIVELIKGEKLTEERLLEAVKTIFANNIGILDVHFQKRNRG
ncbi:hypothetical protein M3591_14905 [Exiguobacterium sp. MER 193]|uniref:DUF6731 family protein n=1 Tax=Exiguobacterium sp. MER 193 TaxID=2939564 RepID=UPI0020418E5D|nr:DUF6731 family protein [Exiguobacterium sp. MER 193]MCM3281780.1 hypothetical protein [Exiguobacterium sp. MER 193]